MSEIEKYQSIGPQLYNDVKNADYLIQQDSQEVAAFEQGTRLQADGTTVQYQRFEFRPSRG